MIRPSPWWNDALSTALSGRFLSNGRYTVLVTDEGTGFSLAGGIGLTRWTGDVVEETEGCIVYVREMGTGRFWTVGDRATARWRPGLFELLRQEDGIEARMEIFVPPEEETELRQITLTNHSSRAREVEITSYCELALSPLKDHAVHPAFSNLFVETEFLRDEGTILASRRRRGDDEAPLWFFQSMGGEEPAEGETDRASFLGRCRSHDRPRALTTSSPLSGKDGPVLDPIASLRRFCSLPPKQSVRFLLLMGLSSRREDALRRARQAWTEPLLSDTLSRVTRRAEREIEAIGLTPAEAERYQGVASAVLHHPPLLRERSRNAPPGWRPGELRHYGISPESPILSIHIDSSTDPEEAAGLARACSYWQALDLPMEVVVLLGRGAAAPPGLPLDPGKGVHLLLRNEIPDNLPAQIDEAARLVLPSPLPDRGTPHREEATQSASLEEPPHTPAVKSPRRDEREDLLFFNGLGGFTRSGDEYVIYLRRGKDGDLHVPPQPWINVIANERIGFLVSETGAGSTWSGNSREHRLTPWYNDPVRDRHGEALYLRDEETGAFWSPLAGPAPAADLYEVRHGFGRTLCRTESHGLRQETCLFVPAEDPVKIVRLRITNTTDRARRISATYYRRLVLGSIPEVSAPHVVTDYDPASGLLLACSRSPGDFPGTVVFSSVVADGLRSVHRCTDRITFLGKRAGTRRPEALLHRAPIGEEAGQGRDPCFAEQVLLEIPPGGAADCSFLFGAGRDRQEALDIAARYARGGAVDEALREVDEEWELVRSGLRVETPDPELDVLANGWLLYQTLACRLRARSAFYQSGGAFGYRDQLQDASALVYSRPDLTRRQILLHGARQFVEGDVLHWWHPPVDRGIRTRFVDDRLWLPYITSFYVQNTGDRAILDEPIPFLTARPLEEGEDEAFLQPDDSGTTADLYEHCCRAIDASVSTGAHGLPLFGTGDWNDGMNRVGRGGKGESVWMGFFLISVIENFLPFCAARSDGERLARYGEAADVLLRSVNEAGWDGEWYRRGFYDDGAPLGSKEADECRIDGLAQAWSVISRAAPPERAKKALDAVEKHLVSPEAKMIRLLTPPFDRTGHDPGYIKGYVPGVRENGGQYTHAALWVVRAMAETGRNNRAAELLRMLSPVEHARTREDVLTYRVEPYVVAADLYGVPPHTGRGGWTWYTGSSAWMYRVLIESILGFRLHEGKELRIQPCIPDGWDGYRLRYRLPGEETGYEIRVENREGRARSVLAASLDGGAAPVAEGSARIPLVHDGKEHHVVITVG